MRLRKIFLPILDEYNNDKAEEDKVIYTDLAGTVTEMSGGIMNAITLVLVAFATISLIVSLIVVGIITYISVLERILVFPINNFIENTTELKNVAQLNPLHAIALILISLVLTVLGGFVPSKVATKKDPVEALRTE